MSDLTTQDIKKVLEATRQAELSITTEPVALHSANTGNEHTNRAVSRKIEDTTPLLETFFTELRSHPSVTAKLEELWKVFPMAMIAIVILISVIH